MFKHIILFAGLLLGVNQWAFAGDFSSEIKTVETRGKEIYNQDTAAWVATDDLLAYMQSDKEFDGSQIGGWVSYKDRNSYKSIFFSKSDQDPQALYEVTSKHEKVESSAVVKRGLTSREHGLWAARKLMLSQKFEACAEFSPYNSVVIEKDNGGYFAYLFASTQKPNLIVLGRHYRFEINETADSVLSQHAFSNSCFALPATAGDQKKSVGLMATHVVTPYPQEHHVFANLMWSIDLYVSVSDEGTGKTYKVTDGQVKLLD